MPVARVVMPNKPTVLGAAIALRKRLASDVDVKKESEAAVTDQCVTLIINMGVRLLSFEEFNHFFERGSERDQRQVTDWVKTIGDRTNVALLITGLETSLAVIERNEQLKGRFWAPITMPRYNWRDKADRGQWRSIVNAFHNALKAHFDLPDLSTNEWQFRLYLGSGGIIGLLAKLLTKLVLNAISKKQTSLGMAEFKRAFERGIKAEDRSGQPLINPFIHNLDVTKNREYLVDQAQSVGAKADEPTTARTKRAKRK